MFLVYHFKRYSDNMNNMEKISISDKSKKVELQKKNSKEMLSNVLPNKEVITEVEKKELKENITNPIPKEKKTLNWNKGLIFLTLSSIVVSITALVYLYLYVYKLPPTPQEIIKLSGEYIESGYFKNVKYEDTLKTPGLPKTEESPLNGLLFTKTEMEKMKKRRPVAVMINNHVQGRPQTGLNEADIVYEAVTESGITRYMAIYWSNGPKVVGPIRSARQYFIEWLSPFDALYIHDGCAATSDPRTNACGNIYTYNIKDVSTRGAWRSSDRFAPHNEYTSIQYAWEYGASMKWDSFYQKTESWKFKKDAKLEDRGQKTKVTIKYRLDMNNYGLYDTQWTYDRAKNEYIHRIGGVTDIDYVTKKPITAKTVIIEEVDLTDAYDGKGRVIIDTIDKGKIKVLMDGKIFNGTWKKDSRMDRTRYYDSAGKELELNRGRVWINVLPKDKGKFDIIEQ